VTQNESGDVRCAYQGEVRNRVVKSLSQELLRNGYVVEQRGWGQAAFLQQVTPELVGDPRPDIVSARLLVLFHNAFLAKHGQQPRQCLRIASADPLMPTAKSQKSIHNLAVQGLDIDVFLFQPAAEIGNDYDLLSDRVVRIALSGNGGRIAIEVFTQRSLAQPFNRAWEGEELVYHSPRVPSWNPKLCRVAAVQTPMNRGSHANARHSPGRGIVTTMPHAA
jgi:hypothetical protein